MKKEKSSQRNGSLIARFHYCCGGPAIGHWDTRTFSDQKSNERQVRRNINHCTSGV